MFYHIPCENDDDAFAQAKELLAAGYEVEVSRSYHPLLKAYVMVRLVDGQDATTILARGGYSVDTLLAQDFSQPVEEEGEDEEPAWTTEYLTEEETEPEPEENVTEETEHDEQGPRAW